MFRKFVQIFFLCVRWQKMEIRRFFEKDHCKIFNKSNQIVASASVYRLNCNSIGTSRSEERVMVAAIDCEIWHRRLGPIYPMKIYAPLKMPAAMVYISLDRREIIAWFVLKAKKTDRHLKKLVNAQKTSFLIWFTPQMSWVQ